MAPEEHRDANDLARAAIERLRSANETSPRTQEAARIPDASRVPDGPRVLEPPRIASATPVRPLPPPIIVSTPTAQTFDSSAGSSQMRPPYAALAATTSPELLWSAFVARDSAARALSDDLRPLADNLGLMTQQLSEKIARESETRQFQSFVRLSAILTHDLKNAIEALSLTVSNMEWHFDNQEFRADVALWGADLGVCDLGI